MPVGKATITPAAPGTVLAKSEKDEYVGTDEHYTYRKGIGKLLHVGRFSRPEILSPVRDCAKHLSRPEPMDLESMMVIMKYCIRTPNRGLELKPNGIWDGDPEHEFVITGFSDSDYAKCPDTRRSVMGLVVYLDGAPVAVGSNGMKSVALSVTKGEQAAGVNCAQSMLHAIKVVEGMRLKVKKPMVLSLENRGSFYLANNWSTGGRTRHVECKQYFLGELK